MSGKNSAPYFPNFGAGAPGAGVPTNSPYYDTATTPFTEYVYHAGAWHQAGINAAGNNAVFLQGVPIDPTAPVLGDNLQFNGALWIPNAGGGGVNPAIVQEITDTGNIQGVTLPAPPTNGNLLIAIAACFNGNPSANWFRYAVDNGGALYTTFVYWHLVGPGEPAIQNPLANIGTAGISMYEISNGAPSFWNFADNGAAAGTVNIDAFLSTGLIIGCAINEQTNDLPTSIVGATADSTASAGAISVAGFHIAAPAKGVAANAVTVTYAANRNKRLTGLFIG